MLCIQVSPVEGIKFCNMCEEILYIKHYVWKLIAVTDELKTNLIDLGDLRMKQVILNIYCFTVALNAIISFENLRYSIVASVVEK